MLEVSEYRRNKLVAMIEERLRLKALEAKMFHELPQLDNLTIKGIMLWKENQQEEFMLETARKEFMRAFG